MINVTEMHTDILVVGGGLGGVAAALGPAVPSEHNDEKLQNFQRELSREGIEMRWPDVGAY
jgi:hypothetical protein